MDFLEITINSIDGESAESVSELFNRYGQGGAVVEAYPPDFDKFTVRTVIPADDERLRRELEVMLALIGQALPAGLPEPRFQPVGESDWAEAWKEHFHVIRVARRFVVKPSWREYTPAPGDLVIEIDPGLAFGSGLHPTTRLCLNLLEDMSLAGRSVFDVGTGSGILTLAALKLAARSARAVDVDDVAVRVARENVTRNGYVLSSPTGTPVESDITIEVGSAGDAGGRQWDVVVANILAHILIQLMPRLVAALAPGGRLLLSGLIEEQEAEVTAAAAAHGLRIIDRQSEEDWLALVAGRGL